jgi:hypothetical protein
MPQLIAMVIVVVGAMIYMFQTFGGTGDKIEGIAQKTSVISEINNIKNGLKIAARGKNIGVGTSANTSNSLIGLARLAYFPEQINTQITTDLTGAARTDATYNNYYAISFGGEEATVANSAMRISLVAPSATIVPGIYVEFQAGGSLFANAGFLESQIANDLQDIAYIDRAATAVPTTLTARAGATTTALDRRLPVATTATTAQLSDGRFIIYFNDFGLDEVVVAE